jgi:hypothetical protein
MVVEMDTGGGKSVGMKIGADENQARTQRCAPKVGVTRSNRVGRAISLDSLTSACRPISAAPRGLPDELRSPPT